VKAYVMTTGALFGVLSLVHVWRVVGGERSLAGDPWFVLFTGIAAALFLWAVWLLRGSTRS
jgi:hypothetical protein